MKIEVLDKSIVCLCIILNIMNKQNGYGRNRNMNEVIIPRVDLSWKPSEPTDAKNTKTVKVSKNYGYPVEQNVKPTILKNSGTNMTMTPFFGVHPYVTGLYGTTTSSSSSSMDQVATFTRCAGYIPH